MNDLNMLLSCSGMMMSAPPSRTNSHRKGPPRFKLRTAPRRVDKHEDVLALVVDEGVVVLGRQDLSRTRETD